MIKIALLLPDQAILDTACRVIREQKLEIDYVRAIQTVNAVSEARMAIEQGAHIIVAHGYQAKLIREYTNIPLVEIRLHTREIGLVFQKAKGIVKKEKPHIGLAVSENMLCDMSHMEELFGIRLSIVYLRQMEHIEKGIQRLARLKPDIIIGAAEVCSEAKGMGFSSLLLEITEESVTEALKMAEHMAYAAEMEQQSAMQMQSAIWPAAGSDTSASPGFQGDGIKPVGEKGGALARLEGYEARTVFEDISTANQRMKEILALAKEYSLSGSPILIYSQEGTEYYLLAEAIHNSSIRRNGPFVSVNAGAMEKEQQLEVLFGRQREAGGQEENDGEKGSTVRKKGSAGTASSGALMKAGCGTLFIKGVEHLTLRAQHQLVRAMATRTAMRTDAQTPLNPEVRIIASSKVHLRSLVQNGGFSEELFYLLHGLVLEIPSLNQRPEDLRSYFEQYFSKYMHMYNRSLTLTNGGRQKLEQLSWNGNLIQLNAFCERLVLTTDRPGIDEVRLQSLYSELYPCIRQTGGEERIVIYQSPEAVELNALLEKHGGNRSLVAEELGISTTTLWRRMKKYGIEARYQSSLQ